MMAEYQELVFGIQVPTIWPVLQLRSKILEVVRKAIMHHLENGDQQVILTINNIPTELNQNNGGIGYHFEIIEEIPRGCYEIYLILPAEIMMISEVEQASIPIETENLTLNSLGLVHEMQRHREVTIAEPNISRILENNGIPGDKIHQVIFRTTYSSINIIEISTILHQITFNADPTILVEYVAENAWDVVCFDKIPAPKWCILEQLDSLLGLCIIGTLFLLLTYSLFVRVGQML